MTDDVVLVDEDGVEIGAAGKLAAHRSSVLHRAVSVFLFDGDGSVLLQQRAHGKYHFAGLWSNTCCTHPRPGEAPAAAGARRVVEEMGVGVDGELEAVGAFVYRARDRTSGLTEHEYDHVFVGRVSGDPAPDPVEVAAWRWVELGELQREVAAQPARYTPWLRPSLDLVVEYGPRHPT